MVDFLRRDKDAVEPMKVLVVDSDARSVRDLVGELRNSGCQALEATTFEAAKQLWIAEKPAALIADVRLGQFNGLQLLLRAKSDRPDVKAVIMSPTSDKVLELETERFGGTFLVKPVNTQQLLSVLFGPHEPQRVERFQDRRVSERRMRVIADFLPDRRLADRRRSTAQ